MKKTLIILALIATTAIAYCQLPDSADMRISYFGIPSQAPDPDFVKTQIGRLNARDAYLNTQLTAGGTIDTVARDSIQLLQDEKVAVADSSGVAAGSYVTGWDFVAGQALKQSVNYTINPESGTTYTFALADDDELTVFTSGSAVTVTIPNHAAVAFPVGCTIDCIQAGAGTVTFTSVDGQVTLNVFGSDSISAGQGASFTLIQTAEDVWSAIGKF